MKSLNLSEILKFCVRFQSFGWNLEIIVKTLILRKILHFEWSDDDHSSATSPCSAISHCATPYVQVGKLCDSMKNVAAGALPGNERHLGNARPFGSVTVPLFQLETENEESIKNILHIPIGTERGMCGSVSSNTVRAAGAMAESLPNLNHKVVVYGKRSAAVCNTMFGANMIVCAGEVKTKVPTWEFCCQLAEFILYEMDYEWDKIIMYFNEYENAARSHQRQSVIYRAEISQIIADLQFPTYEVEGDTRTLIDNLIEYKLASSLYLYMAENIASENGQRLRYLFNDCIYSLLNVVILVIDGDVGVTAIPLH